MEILVATDGTLDADRAADAVARMWESGDTVTVLTVINIPTDFLRKLGDSGVKEASAIALEAGQGFTSGDRAAERLSSPRSEQKMPAADTPVMRALASSADEKTKPVVAALAERGVKAGFRWLTTDNKTARTILTAIKAKPEIGLVVIGSHGKGRFEGVLGSTGTKIVRRSPVSVLMIRNGRPV
jgi:nucleotide-binding universal stress UspA family protein